MSISETVKNWLWSIAIKKGVVSAAKLIVSFALAHGIKWVAAPYGIPIDTTDEGVMVVAINTALAMLRNWLKVKWPGKFGWL